MPQEKGLLILVATIAVMSAKSITTLPLTSNWIIERKRKIIMPCLSCINLTDHTMTKKLTIRATIPVKKKLGIIVFH